jgi:hypothetical protein
MAITATAVAGAGGTGTVRSWDVEATADADTALTITHGLPFADATEADRRMVVIFEPIAAAHFLSEWLVTTRGATTLVITKSALNAGSGAAGTQTRVHVKMQNRGE